MFVKIYTTSWYFVLKIGKKYLYFSRGLEPRVFFKEEAPKIFLRRQDRFLDLFRSQFRNKKLEKILIEKEFIKIFFKEGVVYFFWTKKGLNFVFDFDSSSFCSWTKKKFSQEEFSSFKFLTLVQEELDEEKAYKEFNEKVSLKEKYLKDLEKGLKNLDQGINLKKDLLSSKIDLSQDFLFYHGLKISFKKSDSFYQKRDKVFQKVKAYEDKKKIVLEKINLLKEKNIKEKKLPMKQPYWNRSDEVIFDEKDYFLAIGRNLEENMKLFNQYKKKEDFFFLHLEGQSSAFGFLKTTHELGLTLGVLKYQDFLKTQGKVMLVKLSLVQLKKNGQVLVKNFEVKS